MRPSNPLGLFGALYGETQKPDPFRADEVPVDRGFLAPLATYADGQTELALPAFPLGAIWDGVRSFGAMGFDTPEAIKRNAGAAFDTAGGIVQGGLGVGLAGGMADNAVGSAGGKLTQGIRNAATVGRVNPDTLAISPDPSLNSTWKNTVEAGNILFGTDETYMPAILNEAGDFPLDAYDIGGLSNAWRNKVRTTGELFSNAPSGSSVPLAMNALERAQPQGIRAYHGSPHDFDRFSLDKIGTGEGAQAYGHGLYFADSEDVARTYKANADTPREEVAQPTYDGKKWHELPTNAAGDPEPKYFAAEALNRFGDKDRAIAGLMKDDADFGRESSAYRDAARLLQSGAELPSVQRVGHSSGRMYEVNIRANPEDFLDWDKPLSQQSDGVKQKLGVPSPDRIAEAERLAAEIDKLNRVIDGQGGIGSPHADVAMRMKRDLLDQYDAIDPNGSAWWKMDTKDAAARPDSAAELRKLGIPGIRYLDGMSRSAGEGSSNYVVFDDALVDILRKYANAPTASAVPLAGETQDTDPAILEYLRLMSTRQ